MGLQKNQMLGEVLTRKVRCFHGTTNNGHGNTISIQKIFGCNRFGIQELKKALPTPTYNTFSKSLKSGANVSAEIAGEIAEAVKRWAVEKGVTHYCHWFQPQTGSTAEKHDAIFLADDEGVAFENFTRSELIRGEPDASSFPSGGRRSTFEARGYTAWDPTSPMFIKDTENGKTLCIPSVFISYTGEALDKKTPLLRSMKAIDLATKELLQLLPDPIRTQAAVPVAGPEQEYFLVDKTFFYRRPDLVLTGRMLGGAPSTRGQYLDDHYFGNIPTRVQAFMQEFEYELYKIGVVAKTRHNEVAPSQFEVAVQHQDANIAADHNQMVMVLMSHVAERHDFKLLLHEKPFDGINGSGKHVNWSIRTDEGLNLLSPGKNPKDLLRFLCFLSSVLKGIHQYGGLIRASIGSLGNDKRLGGNEAPPAIISVFLGDAISEIVRQIKDRKQNVKTRAKEIMALGLKSVPHIEKDDTDRNRTSPFAFTGNKFEYRAVGSASSISFPVTVINTVVAEGISQFSRELKSAYKKFKNKETAVMSVLQSSLKETENVIFDGNNYADSWSKEAKRRKLPNYRTSLEAFSELKKKSSIALFESHSVLHPEELLSRYNVRCERYVMLYTIECRTLVDLVLQHVLPSAEAQLKNHYQTLVAMQSISGKQQGVALKQEGKKLSAAIETLVKQVRVLERHIDQLEKKSIDDQMKWLQNTGLALQYKVESLITDVENFVGYAHWDLPKIYEMLHIR